MLKKDALDIILYAIKASLPYENTKRIISSFASLYEKLYVFSIGKAAVPMAQAAADILGDRIEKGLVVTKYGHAEGFSSPYFEVMEAAHPISDKNSMLAAGKALAEVHNLTGKDVCLVLLSGGGSALFEKSIIPQEEYNAITEKLLSGGAGIDEINAVRRRLSLVKGGKFAAAAYPAKVITVALSDVLSNDKQVIASGITVKDTADNDFVSSVADRYLPDLPLHIKNLLLRNTELKINDGGYYFAGDINMLCDAAAGKARLLGYTPEIISRSVTGEASSAAACMVKAAGHKPGRHCYIFGGETTVTLKGSGKGGRNQEMALAAAIDIKDRNNIVFASAGSDGTDGPTDDAGGICDGRTYYDMLSAGVSPEKELENNNSGFALKAADALITTGPTGTNVNDISLVLTDYKDEN